MNLLDEINKIIYRGLNRFVNLDFYDGFGILFYLSEAVGFHRANKECDCIRYSRHLRTICHESI